MLDLQPRVHLHEAEAVRPQPLAAVGDELDRAGADIADRPRRLDRGLAHRGAHLRRHAGRRRLLDHLLVAALQRAVALEEMHDVAVARRRRPGSRCGAATSTYFSTSTRASPKALAASRCALASAASKSAALVDAAHALAAAAGHRLDQHRIADLVGLLPAGTPAPAARRDSRARPARRPARISALARVLQPHGADRRRRRADEDDAGRGAGLGELGVLGEEAVAGMDALPRRSPAPTSMILSIDEIALARRRRPDQMRLVGHRARCSASRVGLRIDRDGAHPEPPRGADDPAGDLAAVGDQDAVEHGGSGCGMAGNGGGTAVEVKGPPGPPKIPERRLP